MEPAGKKHLVQVLIITAILLASGYILFFTVLPAYRFNIFFLIPLFFGGASVGLFLFLINKAKKNMNRFIPNFMGATGIKLLVYILFLILLLLSDRSKAVPVLISFIVIYVVYTFHEVISVLNYLKNNGKSLKS
jgi:peptidoglycan/LPS O-acetylase OafA/YrhL